MSYSYTLWSVAHVHKTEGYLDASRRMIGKAMTNFRKTRDPRGLIYCELTLGEIGVLSSDRGRAEKRFRTALKSAERHRFMLEICHARKLLSLLSPAVNQRRANSIDQCYRKIGARLEAMSFPVSMP